MAEFGSYYDCYAVCLQGHKMRQDENARLILHAGKTSWVSSVKIRLVQEKGKVVTLVKR